MADKTPIIKMTTAKEVIENIQKSFIDAFNQPDITNCLIIYFIMYVMAIILPIYLYYLSQGESPLTSNQYFYIYFFMYIMGLFLCIILFINSERNKKLYMGIFVFIFTVFALLIYYYNNSPKFNKNVAIYFSILFQVVIVLIVIVALALTYKIFENNFRNQTGFIGFIIDLLFYIPCLLIEFVQYLGGEIATTPYIVFILFILEILLILACFYIPSAIVNSVFQNQIQILSESMFLNNQNQLATMTDLMPIVTTDPTTYLDIKTPRKNYTISMWIYLNQQHHNSDQITTNIFSYGSKNDYKPKISYYNSGLSGKNIYRIAFSGTDDANQNQNGVSTGYDIELASQKWNQLVLNYNSTFVDLYINGVLERTFHFNESIFPNYYPTDVVTIGQNNGLDGAICNIAYYTVPLSNYQIVNTYNLLMAKNPPTI